MNRRDAEAQASGRHRRGVPATQAHPQQWDLAERATARQVDQAKPAWVVWYSLGTRHFHAAATWPASEPVMLQARSVDELLGLMREAEHTAPPSQGETMPETPNDLRTAEWVLPHDLSIVGKARDMVDETLTAWALQSLADDVVLVAGELLANAITHGEPLVRLSLCAGPDELCVRVADHSPEQPRRLDLGIEAVHGRGLTIVEALAHDCGVIPFPDRPGKTVWARWWLSPHTIETTHTTTRGSNNLCGQPQGLDV